jgi:hypothetical protein
VAAFRAPFYFINLWLISDRQRNCTYLYYSLCLLILSLAVLFLFLVLSSPFSTPVVCPTSRFLRLCLAESSLAHFLAYLAPLFIYSFSPFSSYSPLSRYFSMLCVVLSFPHLLLSALAPSLSPSIVSLFSPLANLVSPLSPSIPVYLSPCYGVSSAPPFHFPQFLCLFPPPLHGFFPH